LIKRYWHLTLIILFLVLVTGAFYLIYSLEEKINTGLDLSGGTQVILITEEESSEDSIKAAFTILKERIKKLKIVEPRVTMDESKRIIVQLPKVGNLEDILKVIINRGHLEFKIVKGVDIGLKYIEKEIEDTSNKEEEIKIESKESSIEKVEISTEEIEQTTSNILNKLNEKIGEENIEYEKISDTEFNLNLKKVDLQSTYMFIFQILMEESLEKETFERIEITKYDPIYGESIIINGHLKDIKPVGIHPQYPQIKNSVVLFLDKEVEESLKNLLKKNVGYTLSIVLDQIIKTVSNIDEQTIPTEDANLVQIPNIETLEEAEGIAIMLQTGSMPISFKIDRNVNITSTLGKDIINKSLIAISVGFILLFIFKLIYYRGFGLISIFSLILFLILLLSLIILTKAVFTISLISGLFLTVVIFLFSNIFIFEKVKEELYKGRAMITSIDFGFKNSIKDILYINVSIFIIATVIGYFGIEMVKRLSLPIIIGSILIIITLFIFTRSSLLLSSNIFKKHLLSPIFIKKVS